MAAKNKTATTKSSAKTAPKPAAPAKPQKVVKAPAVMELAAPMTTGFDLYCELDAGGGDILRLEHNGKGYIVRKAKTVGEAGNADFQVVGWSLIREVQRLGDGLRVFAAELDRIDGIEPAAAEPASSNLDRLVEAALTKANGRPVATAAPAEAPREPDAPQPGDPAWPAAVSFRDDAFRHDRRLLHVRRFAAWIIRAFPDFMVRINRTIATERNLCVVEMAREPKGDRAADWKSAAFVRRDVPRVMAMSAAVSDDQDITRPDALRRVLRAIAYQMNAEIITGLEADLSVDPLAEQQPIVAAACADVPADDFADWVDGAAAMRPDEVAAALLDAERDDKLEPFARWLTQQRPDLEPAIASHLSASASAAKPAAPPAPAMKGAPLVDKAKAAAPAATATTLPFEQVMELAGGDAEAIWQAIEAAAGSRETGYRKLPADQQAKVVALLRSRAEAKAQGVGVEAPAAAPVAVVVAAKAAKAAKGKAGARR